MALPVQSYVWSRMEQVIGNWVLLVTGLTQDALLWSEQNEPRTGAPGSPYVGLTRRTFTSHGFDTEATTLVPVQAAVLVTASVAGETASIVLGRRRLAYTLVGADDAETARDDLLAQIAAAYEPVIATPSGIDAIDIVGKGGQIVRVVAVEGASVADLLEYRRHTLGLRRAIVRVSLFAFDPTGDESGAEYADALISSLQTQGDPGSVFLNANRVGVEAAASISVQNVSTNVPGPKGLNESRDMFDVQFNAASARFFPANGLVSVGDPIVEVTTLQAIG